MSTYTFSDDLPDDISTAPLLISGPDSLAFDGKVFLLIHQNDGRKSAYKIRYEYHCSPFKAAILTNHVLAAGYEACFYLFDISTDTHLLSLQLSGYFGYLYIDNGLFYVADANGITCINQQGEVLWDNHQLGTDGVIIDGFTENKISGTGEWDAPGEWRKFVIAKETGENLPVGEYINLH